MNTEVVPVAEQTRPSFLVLMADQLAAQWLPTDGQHVVDAPNITALAREAIVFDATYCSVPLCAPSRAAMMTGRFASRDGVYDNAAELPATVPTVAHRFRAAGYQTSLVGKMHFVGPDQLHGFERRLTTDVYPADIGWTPDWTRPLDDPLDWYHTMESVLEPGVCAAANQTDFDNEVAYHAVRELYDIARDDSGRPFFMVASFTNPHDPWELPERYWARYRRNEIPLPAAPALPSAQLDPHSRRLRAMYGFDASPPSDAEILRARHGYFAAVSYFDERVGEVLAALHDSGLEEQTTVVVCSDHGELLGEHGLWYKMSFLDPSARVPWIVRPAAAAGAAAGPRRVATPVSLLDLGPTLLDLAGLEPAPDGLELDGVSQATAVRGAGPAHERPVLSEYLAEGVQAPTAMVRSGDYKLISSLHDPDLLYDLHSDPLELSDLGADPAFSEVRARLRTVIEETFDFAQLDRRVRASQRVRRLVNAALTSGAQTAWDFTPPIDGANQYIRNGGETLEATQQLARLDSGDPDAF